MKLIKETSYDYAYCSWWCKAVQWQAFVLMVTNLCIL